MLYRQHFIHAFQTEPTLAVEEIGDVGLLETGQLGQMKSGQVPLLDPFPQSFAEIFLQSPESHVREYSTHL